MLKVNFKDGTTLAFDLNRKDDVQQWLEWSSVKDFQERITGVGILHNKKFYAVPYPKYFRMVRLEADLLFTDKGGVQKQHAERLVCYADDVKFSLTVYTYNDPPPPIALRVDMLKVKHRRWDHEKMGLKHG